MRKLLLFAPLILLSYASAAQTPSQFVTSFSKQAKLYPVTNSDFCSLDKKAAKLGLGNKYVASFFFEAESMFDALAKMNIELAAQVNNLEWSAAGWGKDNLRALVLPDYAVFFRIQNNVADKNYTSDSTAVCITVAKYK